jgi:hypothetical protein
LQIFKIRAIMLSKDSKAAEQAKLNEENMEMRKAPG